jgi:hypothetical protein
MSTVNPTKPQNKVLPRTKTTHGQKKWALHSKEKEETPWRTNQPTKLNYSPKGHSMFIHIDFHKRKPPLRRKFVVYVEGTLYPLISFLESGRGILCLLIDVRTLPLLRSWHNNPPIHTSHDLWRFGS